MPPETRAAIHHGQLPLGSLIEIGFPLQQKICREQQCPRYRQMEAMKVNVLWSKRSHGSWAAHTCFRAALCRMLLTRFEWTFDPQNCVANRHDLSGPWAGWRVRGQYLTGSKGRCWTPAGFFRRCQMNLGVRSRRLAATINRHRPTRILPIQTSANAHLSRRRRSPRTARHECSLAC